MAAIEEQKGECSTEILKGSGRVRNTMLHHCMERNESLFVI